MADRGKADVEGMLAFIAEHTSDLIVRFGADGTTYVSPSVRRYGYEPEALLGHALDVVHPDDQERLRRNNADLMRGIVDPHADREHRFRTGSGEYVWLQGNPQVVRDANGDVVEVINILRDVTHRRAAEEAARRETEQFEAAFRHAPIGKALVDLDGRFLRLNRALCRMLGYSEAELLERDFQSITHPDDLASDLALMRRLFAGETDSYALDKRYIRADGSEIWVNLSVSLARHADGTPRHYLAQVQDLTERRAAEQALRESEARYRALAEASDDITAQLNMAGELTYVSPAVRNYGYAEGELVGLHMSELVHPEDMPRAATNLALALTNQLAPAPERVVRMKTKAGEWVWMEGNPHLLRGLDGQPTGFVTTLRDVTERREQEQLFEAAFEQAAIGKSIVAVGGRCLRANEAMCRLLGYTESELQAIPVRELFHPDDANKDQESAAELIAGRRQSHETTRRLRRANGGYVWCRITVTLVRYADGQPKHYVNEVEDLTGRYAAEAALKASEERYRLIAENSSDMIVVSDLSGQATFVSRAVHNVGRRPEDIEGRSALANVHPDELPQMLAACRALLEGAKTQRVRWRGPDVTTGGWIWFESNLSLMRSPDTGEPTGFLDMIRNVQPQVEQEEALAKTTAALQESEARYRLIAENTSDIIVMTEINGRISHISPSVSSLGYSPEELIGTAFIKQIHPEDIERVWTNTGSLPPGATGPRVRWRARHKLTGEWVWLESQPTMLRDPLTGAPSGIIDVVRDVNIQVEQEQALARARAEAEAAAAAKSQFLANMSHEIRTPLTAVLGFTSLLSDLPELPETARGYVERISGAGKGLLAIVNDILDYSKLEAGKFEVRPRPTDVVALTEETLLLFSNQAEEKGLSLSFQADPDLPRAVFMDGDRLRQTLINLIGNAVKFTERGRVSVAVRSGGAEQVRIEVADTGPGLDLEAQQRLFQRFSQVDDSTTRRHGGTGLGLAICKGVAEAMGGTIGVVSTPGDGATFYVVLPAPRADMPQELTRDAAPLSIEGVRVFLVDDNATNRELARRILEAAGAEVEEAADGLEALERLSLLPVDVVLMDLRMPRLDGRGALTRLRATPGPNQMAPVLAFTADADLASDGDLEGFDGLVRKPIQPLELYGAIATSVQWPELEDEVSYAAR